MGARRRQIPANAHTVFSFQLPYAIPVPDGNYNIRLSGEIAEIQITRVQREDLSGWKASRGSFIQFQHDKYGKSSFSDIKMKIPRILDIAEDGRTPIFISTPPRRRCKEILLRFLNRFIECVKVSVGTYWVESARYQDISSFNIAYWDGSKTIPGSQTLLDTGVGGIGFSTGHPFRIEEDTMTELNRILENEETLETSDIFLLNSKDACLQEDFRLAIIEAVTALEVVLYRFIRQRGDERGIAIDRINSFIKEVGLSGSITVVMRLLIDDITDVEDILSICTGAITTRNNILHRGFRDLPARENEERVQAIERLIEFIKRQ